jgi:hypothetical protein
VSGLWNVPENPERPKKIVISATLQVYPKYRREQEMTVMNLTIFDQVAQLGQEHLTIDAASLYRAFEQVKDG